MISEREEVPKTRPNWKLLPGVLALIVLVIVGSRNLFNPNLGLFVSTTLWIVVALVIFGLFFLVKALFFQRISIGTRSLKISNILANTTQVFNYQILKSIRFDQVIFSKLGTYYFFEISRRNPKLENALVRKRVFLIGLSQLERIKHSLPEVLPPSWEITSGRVNFCLNTQFALEIDNTTIETKNNTLWYLFDCAFVVLVFFLVKTGTSIL